MSLSHAAKAEALIADEMQGGSFDQTRDYIAIAQVHATLALVEQQKLANRIALGMYANADGSRPFQHFVATPINEYSVSLDDEIRERLGLS